MARLRLIILVGLITISVLIRAVDPQGYYEARFTQTIPVINGDGSDTCWNKAAWAPIGQVWIGNAVSETDFSGKFKVMWTQNRLYLLIRIVDDSLRIQPTGLADVCSNIYNYDCSEIFIDENHSRDLNYTGTYKTIAYHLDTTHVCYYVGAPSGWVRLDDHLNYNIKRVATHTFDYEYEIKVFNDAYIYGGINIPVQLTNGKLLGWSVAYNDNDEGSTRQNMFGSKYIEGADKNISYYNASAFGELKLIGGITTELNAINNATYNLAVIKGDGSIQITYSSNQMNAEVLIELFDVYGRQIFNIIDYKSGIDFEKELTISNLTKGIYIIRVTEKGKSKSEKIIL